MEGSRLEHQSTLYREVTTVLIPRRTVEAAMNFGVKSLSGHVPCGPKGAVAQGYESVWHSFP